MQTRMCDEKISLVIVSLDYICEKINVTAHRRTEILGMLKRWYLPGLRSYTTHGKGRGHKVEAQIEKTTADEFIRVFLAKRKEFINNKTTSGVIYCFVGQSGRMIDNQYKHLVKVGKAGSWEKRKRKFRGATAIKTEIAIRPTSNRHVAERACLKMMTIRYPTCGGEWFLVAENDLIQLKKQFLEIAIPV